MPTSFVGLLLFVALLAPGLAYVARRRVLTPITKPSVFRETATVVLLSAASDAFALALLGAVRGAFPDQTPDVGALVLAPRAYFQRHYIEVFAWGTGTLIVACLLALAGAAVLSARPVVWLLSLGFFGWLLGRGENDERVTTEPAWWRLFSGRPERIHLGCELDDGSWVSGYLASYSAESDETADREFVLAEELKYLPAGAQPGTEPQVLNASAVVVSARRLQLLHVTYVP